MFSRARELWYSLIAIVAVTALYALAYRQEAAFPAASGLVGHWIGVAGFVLILMTETLYSLRKQTTDAKWGSMAAWLTFHMFTGIVGPYMVLLHTAMNFRGLAGIAMLLTGVVVLSGMIGRYVYTAVPRVMEAAVPVEVSAAGSVSPAGSAVRLGSERGALATWYVVHVPLTWVLLVTALVHMGAALYYATLQR